MSSKYSSNNYEYGKSSNRGDSNSTYSFGNRGDESTLGGDFWDDIKDDDDDDNAASRPSSSKCSCCTSIAAFYRPSTTTTASSGGDEFADLDFTTTSNAEREVASLYYKLRAGSTMVAAISLVFWIWALVNTHSMEGQDLGIYSFLMTLISSHYILCKTPQPSSVGVMMSRIATPLVRVLVTASHALVSANYVLGVLFSYTVGKSIYYVFGTYCLIFSGLWGYGITYQGFLLLQKLQKYEAELHRSEEEEEEVVEGEEYLF